MMRCSFFLLNDVGAGISLAVFYIFLSSEVFTAEKKSVGTSLYIFSEIQYNLRYKSS